MSKQAVANKGGRGARQRILDTAAELFYRDGINATGVERLAAESSVSKRTLYQHFPSKTAVVEEYLRSIEQRSPIRCRPAPAIKRHASACWPSSTPRRHPPGRYAAAPSTTRPSRPPEACREFTRLFARTKRSFIDGLTELAGQAGAADPRQLGNQLAVLSEGAAALATSLDDPSPWACARKTAAEALIDQALAR